MAYVFQYGSNTQSDRTNSSNRLRGDARPIGLVYTENNFELDFTTWSEGNQCAAADIVPGSGRKIWGVLYKVPDELIERRTSGNRKSFDAIEGSNYRREPIKLRYSDGTPFQENAITYLVIDKQHGIGTSLEYARHIIFGLREHNAPDEYIEYLKSRIVSNNPDLKQDIQAL